MYDLGLCDSGSALPVESVLVNRRAWRAISIRVKVATERRSARCCGCLPHYFCPAARIVLHILGKRDGVKLSSVFIAPLHY